MKNIAPLKMKKINRFLVILACFIIPLFSVGQPPEPPPCPTPGQSGNKVGGESAPIEDGVPVFLGLALLYAAYKMRIEVKNLKKSENDVAGS